VYLGELEIRRRGLPTVRSGSVAPVKDSSEWEVAERLTKGIGTGWREHDEFRQTTHGSGSVLGDREEEDRAMQLKKRRV
jgi:hypothetical protein